MLHKETDAIFLRAYCVLLHVTVTTNIVAYFALADEFFFFPTFIILEPARLVRAMTLARNR